MYHWRATAVFWIPHTFLPFSQLTFSKQALLPKAEDSEFHTLKYMMLNFLHSRNEACSVSHLCALEKSPRTISQMASETLLTCSILNTQNLIYCDMQKRCEKIWKDERNNINQLREKGRYLLFIWTLIVSQEHSIKR